MVIMENYYSPDRFHELWQKINKHHLIYIDMEESPEKLEHRLKLEEYIKDLLCIASHNQKFTFVETAEVLQRSAASKKDFSAYKAATGWNAIQQYAGNLLSQPWRKEYRQIKTYCGFYKHQIEANLVGAEIMFEAMGYKHVGNGILVLDDPICPDRVADISKDCLVAYVESQILKYIWEEVTPSFSISWLEILEFRRTHICSPEQSVKALKYRQHQRQYQEHTRSYSQGTDIYTNNRCPPISIANTSPVLPVNHSFPPLSGHNHATLPPQPVPQYIYNGCCANNFATYAHYPYQIPVQIPQQIAKPQFNTNGYYYTNGYVTPQPHPSLAFPVPTGQLIELESHSNGYDIVDHPKARNSIPPEHNQAHDLPRIKSSTDTKVHTKEKSSDKGSSQFEDWEYVYKDLENQGYSKDLGERGDLLNPPHKHGSRDTVKKSRPTNIDEAMNNLVVSDKPLKMTEALEKLDRDKRKTLNLKTTERRNSQGSSYENLSPVEVTKKSVQKMSTPIISKTKLVQRDKVFHSNESVVKPSQSKTVDMRKSKDDKFKSKEKESNFGESSKTLGETSKLTGKWQCRSCTFLNNASKDICEMCSKSKGSATEQPMEIGGSECSQCTLVNPRDAKTCQACLASLKDSPTYI